MRPHSVRVWSCVSTTAPYFIDPDHPTPSTHHLLQRVGSRSSATWVIWHARYPTTQSPHDHARRLTPGRWVLRTRRARTKCVVTGKNPPLPPLSRPNQTVRGAQTDKAPRTTITVELRDTKNHIRLMATTVAVIERRGGARARPHCLLFLGCGGPVGPLCRGIQTMARSRATRRAARRPLLAASSDAC
jgi:hypothetical protein